MKRFALGMMGVALASAAAITALAPATATAAGPTSDAIVKWSTQAIVTMSLTPNYYTGFGAVKAVFGTQPAAVPGPHAGPAVGQGDVDFGDVLSGTDYLYKYAAEINVVTNDPSGFKLYGEGAADFAQNGGAGSAPLSSTLFYTTSGATSDSNNGFTPGLPFEQTAGGVTTGATYAGPGTINYGGVFPGSPVASSITATGTFYYDYLLKVPSSITTGGDYYVWIVYTVVGS